MAEAIFAQKLKESGLKKLVHVDSAGTYASAPGSKPDPRATKIIKSNGGSMKRVRSRKIQNEDFDKFDYILAMDRQNHEDLVAMSPGDKEKIWLIMQFSETTAEDEVPDPYFGSISGFTLVYTLLNDACNGLLSKLAVGPDQSLL